MGRAFIHKGGRGQKTSFCRIQWWVGHASIHMGRRGQTWRRRHAIQWRRGHASIHGGGRGQIQWRMGDRSNGGGDMPPSAGEVGDRRPPSAGFNGGGDMPPSAEDVGGRRPPSAEFNIASLSGLGMFLSRSSSSHLVSCFVSRLLRHISGGEQFPGHLEAADA